MDGTAEYLYNPAMQPQETASPPPNVLVTGHYRERPGYAVYRKHGSGNWLVTYTIEGHGLYRQPGLALRTSPGDLVLLQPGAMHDYSVPSGCSWEFLWAHFHPRLPWLSWWRLAPVGGGGLYRASLRTAQARARALQAFEKLHTDSWAAGPLGRELALNGLEEVFLLAEREHGSSEQRPLDHRVQQVLGLISRDLGARHDVPTLARRVTISPSRLSHLFREEVGDSVSSTVLTMRLRQAARLLEFTVRNVGEISEEVGFRSPFYFSRQFRQRYGVCPREYRARLTNPEVFTAERGERR